MCKLYWPGPPFTYIHHFPKEDLLDPATSEQSQDPVSIPLQNQDITRPSIHLETPVNKNNRSIGQLTPIHPVEPILGLTQEEQEIQEEALDLSFKQLLGLSYCQDQVNTPLQTLDGIYVRQPSRFLPLGQEAQKIAKKIKEKELPNGLASL